MPEAVAERDQPATAAPPAEPDDDGLIPNWRILPPVPLTNARSLDAADIPDSIKRQVLDASVFTTIKPFTMTAYGSNQALDAYSTQMQDSSLRNYAADAAEGRAFLDSHRYRELPIGKTHDGRFKQGAHKRAEMDVYMLPGRTAGRGGDTDSIIDHIRAGIYSDVSISFDGGKMMCSICDLEMVDSWFRWLFADEDDEDVCLHIAGVEYAKVGKDGKPTSEREVAIGKIEDAHLLELSIVYDGATPGAAIVKARSMAEYGMLEAPAARQLEQVYARERVRFPNVQRVHVIPRLRAAPVEVAAPAESRDAIKPGDREVTMPEPTTNGTTTAPDPLESIRALVREVGWAPEGEWSGDAPAIATVIRERAKLLRDQEPDAVAGRAYKADLVKFALDEGVRARGDKFNREKWEPILKGSEPDTIRLYMEDWGIAAETFFKPGRATVETEERPTDPKAEAAAARVPRNTPFSAFTG